MSRPLRIGMVRQALRQGIFLVSLVFLAAAASAAEQVANVCVQCHGALAGRLGEPVQQWRGSIHAGNGIFCDGCHGGDPKDAVNAMSPLRGFLGKPKQNEIPGFCGRCHVGILDNFRTSAHGKAVGRGGPTCVTCHGNHLVKKASLDLINEKSCSRCHPFERARLIREAMVTTEARIVAIDRRIDGFKGKGVDTTRLEQRLFAARNRFHALSHVLAVSRINDQTREIVIDLDSIDGVMQEFDTVERKRKLMGAFAIALALLAALLLTLYRQTLD